jgi:hypothetical protein
MHTTKDFEIVALTEYPEDIPVMEKVIVKRSLLEPWRQRPRHLDLTPEEWELIKKEKKYQRSELQDQLDKYQAQVSKDAVLPKSLLKGMKLPGKNGKAIAEYAQLHSV